MHNPWHPSNWTHTRSVYEPRRETTQDERDRAHDRAIYGMVGALFVILFFVVTWPAWRYLLGV